MSLHFKFDFIFYTKSSLLPTANFLGRIWTSIDTNVNGLSGSSKSTQSDWCDSFKSVFPSPIWKKWTETMITCVLSFAFAMFYSTAKASAIRHIRWTITFGRLFSIDLCCFAWWFAVQYHMVLQRWTDHLRWWRFDSIPWKTKQFVEYRISFSKTLGHLFLYRVQCSGSCKCYDNTVHTGFVHSLSRARSLRLTLFFLSTCVPLIILCHFVFVWWLDFLSFGSFPLCKSVGM